MDLDLEIKKGFEENSPYQEGIISEIYQRPYKSQLVDPPELIGLVNYRKDSSEIFTKTDRYR